MPTTGMYICSYILRDRHACLQRMQEPPAVLCTWLKFSHEHVTTQSVANFLGRVKAHLGDEVHGAYVSALAADTPIDDLPRDVDHAIFSLIRAAQGAKSADHLPARARSSTPVAQTAPTVSRDAAVG